MRYPKNLEIGEYISTTAPSEGIVKEINWKRLDNAKKNLSELGYKYKETSNVRKDEKGRSSSAKERAKQFMELWQDKETGSIISAAGGFFLNEMIDEIEWEKIKELEPKWFQGYSDNTGITYLLTTLADIACIYGPNVKDYGMRKLYKNLQNSLKIMKGEEITQESFEKCENGEWSERIDPYEEYSLTCENEWKNLNREEKIHFKGRSIGGCLNVITDLIGTKYDKTKEYIEKYKEDGIVWFLEACEMSTPVIYCKLWQMKNAGYFRNSKGIIFGRPIMLKEEYDMTQEECIKQALKDLNIPIIYNADIGHIAPQIPILSGGILEIECKNGKGKITNYFK